MQQSVGFQTDRVSLLLSLFLGAVNTAVHVAGKQLGHSLTGS